MRSKRFSIAKPIFPSFLYRFLVHDNANKTRRRKELSEVKLVNSLVRLFVVSREARWKKRLELWGNILSLSWVIYDFPPKRNFGKEKVFLPFGPKSLLSFTTGTQLLLHDSVIYDDDHPTSSFRERTQSIGSSSRVNNNASIYIPSMLPLQDDRMFTPEKDANKNKKLLKSKQVSEIHNHVMRIGPGWSPEKGQFQARV